MCLCVSVGTYAELSVSAALCMGCIQGNVYMNMFLHAFIHLHSY